MEYKYITRGTCSKSITFELDDNNLIHNVNFEGGCNGNLKAISKLVEGHDANEIIGILKGNLCGQRKTSCADQLSLALENALNNK